MCEWVLGSWCRWVCSNGSRKRAMRRGARFDYNRHMTAFTHLRRHARQQFVDPGLEGRHDGRGAGLADLLRLTQIPSAPAALSSFPLRLDLPLDVEDLAEEVSDRHSRELLAQQRWCYWGRPHEYNARVRNTANVSRR